MNFKGHLAGGITVASILGCTAAVFCNVPPVQILSIVGTTLFFSLLPDVDITSIPQRWFYRTILVILFIFATQQQFMLATLLAMLALTPLLSKHRGWTHNLLSPVLAPVVIAAGYHYIFIQPLHFNTLAVKKISLLLTNNIWLVLACSLGWLTHLALDYMLPQIDS